MFSDLKNKPHDLVGGCSGLVSLVSTRMGHQLPLNWNQIENIFFREIQPGRQEVGDIVHIITDSGTSHVGIMVSKYEIWHSTEKRGVHKLKIDHPWLLGRIVGFYRHVKHGSADDPSLISPLQISNTMSLAAGDDSQTLALISLAVLSTVVSYGIGAYASSFWGSVAGMATMVVGGMLINNAFAPPDIESSADDSPTYGWSAGSNTASTGITIPVIYGYVATYPNIINQWIEIDSNYDQWSHTLLCIGEGETNNVPASTDIYIDDQPITTIDGDNYTIQTTTGEIFPQTTMTNHEYLHQMRPINKQLVAASLSNVLLHFNGDDDSTLIVDDGVGVADDPDQEGDVEHVNTWTCQATADLSTTHPFLGTGYANLNLETDGDYITCDELLALTGFRNEFDFECRFRQDALTDSAIIGQFIENPTDTDNYWGLFYYSGELVFQTYSYDGADYTVYANVSEAVTLSTDTWHHIRVAKTSTYNYLGVPTTSTIHFYLDGTLIGSNDFTAVFPSPVDIYYDSVDDENMVGKAYYYNGATIDTEYGNCELDELRMVAYHHIYDLAATFTVPTSQIADEGEYTYYTKCEIDSFKVTVNYPSGLTRIFTDTGYDDTGTYYSNRVDYWVAYRLVGTSTWYRYYTFTHGNQTSPAYDQWTFTPEDGRGLYEIRIARLTSDDASSSYQEIDTSMLSSIDEILHETLRYPHLQLVSISQKASDKYSGRIPQYKIVSNRSSIMVPNYSGRGVRMVNPSNNANCAFDLATNKIYGAGIDPTRLTETYWEEWVDYCNVLVDGNKRCQTNMAFDQIFPLDEALKQVEMCGRARISYRGSKLVPIINNPIDSETNLYVPENIKPGTNQITYLRTRQKSDAVEITYIDKDKGWKEETVMAKGTGFDSLTTIPNIVSLNIRGINNQDQAEREALLRQQISETTLLSDSFQTGIEGILDLPGDVIEHGKGTLTFTGRISRNATREEEYTGTIVYLDQEITLASATYSGNCIIQIRNPLDDSIDQFSVTGPFDTATRYVNVNASGMFYFLSPWKILRSSGEIHKFRIQTVRRTSNMSVEVTGLQYDETAYYNSNYAGGVIPI